MLQSSRDRQAGFSRYRVRFSHAPEDITAAQRLRARTFRGSEEVPDGDAFDDVCIHVLVEEVAGGRLMCCFRLLPLSGGSEIGRSYSAQYYDLAALASMEGGLLEMGRFCVAPEARDGEVVRVAWTALARYVEAEGFGFLFGCSSFSGTEEAAYADAFALLKERHLAPRRLLPKVKAPAVFRFASRLRLKKPDLKAAMKAMPPLLRSYLAMGGWVSDHAVIDRDLGTLHVFTGLEVGRVSAARKRLLLG